MNLHAAAAYMLHLLRSRSTEGHGVHSPFMFRFITEVLGGRTAMETAREVESLRKEMLSDTREVRVSDLGAGSAVMRGEERSIRRIASAAALPARDAALLARIAGSLDMIRMRERGEGMPADPRMGKGWQHRQENGAGPRFGQKTGSAQQPYMETDAGQRQSQKMVSEQQPGMETDAGQRHTQKTGEGLRVGPVILELGTSLGISTLALALGAPDRKVISVEGCPELSAIARENLHNHGARNAEVICMEFSEALRHLTSLGIKVEMAFIDGNHRGSALADYVKTIRNMGEEIIIIADDIRMNRDMTRTWRNLTGNQKASPGTLWMKEKESSSQTNDGKTVIQNALVMHMPPVSLETFRLGMIFFLRNCTPGLYRLRC